MMDELELIGCFRRDEARPNPLARAAAREFLIAHMKGHGARVVDSRSTEAAEECLTEVDAIRAFRRTEATPSPVARAAARDHLIAHIEHHSVAEPARERSKPRPRSTVPAGVAKQPGAHALRFALEMLREDELAQIRRALRQDSWLTRPNEFERTAADLTALSTAIADGQLLRTCAQTRGAIPSLAAVGSLCGSHVLFETLEVLVLPLLAHAFLSCHGSLPRSSRYELYTRALNQPERSYAPIRERRSSSMVLGGLAAIGTDTVLPVSLLPLTSAVSDEPFHWAPAIRDPDQRLAHLRMPPDMSVAGFAGFQFGLLQQARAVVKRALERRSSICQRHGVDPGQLLEYGLPNRVVLGHLALGRGDPWTPAQTAPGIDADVRRVGVAHGIEVLAYAHDHMASLQVVPVLLSVAGGYDADRVYGSEAPFVLADATRADLGHNQVVDEYGVDLTSGEVRYFCLRGKRSMRSGERGLTWVADARDRGGLVWCGTPPSAGAAGWSPITTREVHQGTRASAGHRQVALDRFFSSFASHARPRSAITRAYADLAIMVANLESQRTDALKHGLRDFTHRS